MKKIASIIILLVMLITLLISCASPEQPLTVEALLELGEKYLNELEYEQALIPFTAVIEIDPMLPRGYTGAAEAYIGLGRTNDAINILKKGLEVLPNDPDIIGTLINLYIDLNMYDDALALIEHGMNNTENQPKLQPLLNEILLLTHDHEWIDADCFNPRVCAICGETEGTHLEHVLLDATFQQPQICTVCGETEGSPLTPGFIEHGFVLNAIGGVTYPYETVTYNRPDIPTTGEAMLYGFVEHEETIEGYEMLQLVIDVTFSDQDAKKYGYNFLAATADYYSFDPNKEIPLYYEAEDSDIPGYKKGDVVQFNDLEYETYFMHFTYAGFENNIGRGYARWFFIVPIGYDGIIIWLTNYEHYQNGGNTISELADEKTLWFKLR